MPELRFQNTTTWAHTKWFICKAQWYLQTHPEIKNKYNLYPIQQNFDKTNIIALRNMGRHNTPPHYFVNWIVTKGS
jgi:hypothetical protein